MDEILNELKSVLAIASKDYLTFKEAAIYLGISEDSFRKHVNELPRYKPNKRIYFAKTDIKKWMEANRVDSNSDIRRKAEIFTDNT